MKKRKKIKITVVDEEKKEDPVEEEKKEEPVEEEKNDTPTIESVTTFKDNKV